MKRIEKYFSKHVSFNSFVHSIGGIGIGIILARPIFDLHPLRWGAFFILLSLLGHLYAYKQKKEKT